jgi:hypothetical protein
MIYESQALRQRVRFTEHPPGVRLDRQVFEPDGKITGEETVYISHAEQAELTAVLLESGYTLLDERPNKFIGRGGALLPDGTFQCG